MAKIIFTWDGKANTTAETSTDYFRGTTSGYFNAKSYTESWTGKGLIYDPNVFLSKNPYPVSGTIESWNWANKVGTFDMKISGASFVIPQNLDYSEIIAGLVSGQDEWIGNNENNYFFFSVGNDTYYGNFGIDTIDAFIEKQYWITGSTKFQKDPSGKISVANFGSASLTLDSIERIRFSDKSIAIDLDGNAGNAARTLATVFGKDALKNTTYAGIAI